jgi:hypothetical protein
MIAVQFIFTQSHDDEEFQSLDSAIADYAKSLPGHLGVDTWVSREGTSQNSIYYFSDREALADLAGFPDHLRAKANVDRWYSSYQVVVTEVLASYGTHTPPHLSTQHT